MKTQIFLIIAAVILFTTSHLAAAEDKYFYESGQILPGEEWGNVYIYNDDTIVDMLGGTVLHYIASHDYSSLNMTAGDVGAIYAWDNSVATISGGELWGIEALDYATVNFSSNAETKGFWAESFGTVNMIGGTVEHAGTMNSATMNLYGGAITDRIGASGSSVINVYGYDLIKSSSGGSRGYGYVSGFWFDDTPFTISFGGPETHSHVNLIPEPATLLLLGLGGLLLRKKTNYKLQKLF